MRLCVCVFCARCDAQRIMGHEKLFKPKGPLRVKKKNIVVVVLKIVCK
jgi:hypothetical protein